MNRQDAEKILNDRFGIESFYDEQWEAIEKLLNGERILMIQRTGFGKSLVFQFTAMMLDGTTIIFSPLIALMRDQIKKLNKLNIPAACINSELSPEEKTEIYTKAKQGKYKMLYIAPERQDDIFWQETVLQLKLSMVVVDEAHCVSTWGHDFRPSYRKIVDVVKQLDATFPVLACTATATPRVQEDIHNQFNNSNLTVIRGNLTRSNFSLNVLNVENQEAKMADILNQIQTIDGTGIIYCGTQVESEIFSKWLEFNGINATFYNAGLDKDSRIHIEQGLMNNEYKCVVSTNALGMGIDKGDIRFIIHTQVPTSLLHYYQEIGRSGRDGKPTKIILYYNPSDDELPLSFINSARPTIHQYNNVIECLKQEQLGLNGIIKKVNLKKTKVRVILADLVDQKIITKDINTHKYEYIYNAPELDMSAFEELRQAKLKDFKIMKNYLSTKECRMKFIKNYLGDSNTENCNKCDNDILSKSQHYYAGYSENYPLIASDEILNSIQEYREAFFPILKGESRNPILHNGVAASYYGVSNVGTTLNRCKYHEGGDFPDYLLKLTLKAYRKHFKSEIFDLILYVPPTESGDLVKNFAIKINKVLGVPISHNLVKTRETEPQKMFESAIGKRENIVNAFAINENVNGKKILLIDDIYDSGHTIKTIATMLKNKGAEMVAPLTIAKTVGGR